MNIIDGLQKKVLKVVERIITIIGWLLMLGYLVQIILSFIIWAFNIKGFYNNLFTPAMLQSTLYISATTILIAVSVFIVAFLWGAYNYKKYAHLNRRQLPPAITTDEIQGYFDLSEELTLKMQRDKVIYLEKTIV